MLTSFFSGLIVIAILILVLKEDINLKVLSRYADFIVGAFMVALGAAGAATAVRDYKLKNSKKITYTAHVESDGDSQSAHVISTSYWFEMNFNDPYIQKIAAFLIGTVHGIGGPGGVLGVLPAAELYDWQGVMLYVLTFVITSTLCMGAFAAIYGEVTKRLGTSAEIIEYSLNLFSCGLSAAVGALWIILSALGLKDKLFH
jgi:hypothetical protein